MIAHGLAWCSPDEFNWCGQHNRPYQHCKAEASDTIAAQYIRLIEEIQEIKKNNWPPMNSFNTGAQEALSAVLRLLEKP